jgi:DDE superfamily endonuclease
LPTQTLVLASKYLNNLIERDHRMAPQRCYPMLGFKIFRNAEVTLSGIELANKIKKGQFDTSEITGPRGMILQVWEAAHAAWGEVEIGSVCLPSKNCARTGHWDKVDRHLRSAESATATFDELWSRSN